ncbi:MAG: hypothetical protein AAFP85_09760 [Pseudomonadota bacterium]
MKSFIFSFAILWRLFVVMPFVTLALMVFAAMVVIWLVCVAVFFPSVIFLLSTLVIQFPQIMLLGILAIMIATTSVVPLMIGARLGLQAKGVIVKANHASMFLPALGYGAMEALFSLVVISWGAAIFLMISPLTLADLTSLASLATPEAFDAVIEENKSIFVCVLVGVGLILMAFRAALLVPFAGASIGLDPDGRKHTPFWGAGTRCLSLTILVMAAYMANFLNAPFLNWVASLMGLDLGLVISRLPVPAGFERVKSPIETWQAIVLVVAFMSFSLWLFSLQCAGAVLSYLEIKDRIDGQPDESDEIERMSQQEMRALWKGRMPAGRT